MSTPRYSDLIRKELETNANLTSIERVDLLKTLALMENKKIDLARERVKRGKGLKKDQSELKRRPEQRLVELPSLTDDPPAVPMGQQVDSILAELQKAGQESQVKEEGANGSGKLDESSGPE
jgi:hypothetical protein